MRPSIRTVAAIAAAAALGIPAASASATGSATASAARKHCKSGYTLKHNKCVKKPKHKSGTPPPVY